MVNHPAGLQLLALGRDRWLKWPAGRRVPGDVWMRTYQEPDGRWRVGTVVIDTMPIHDRDGERGPITGDVLKSVRVAEVERYLNQVLGTDEATGTTDYKPRGWSHSDPVAMLRELSARAKSGQVPRKRTRYRLTVMPPDGRLTDDYLGKVVKAYQSARDHDLAPAPTIAADTGAAVRTVRSWIHKARQRGLMAPGRRGIAG